MASLPPGIEFEDVPFSEIKATYIYEATNLSQTSGCNPGLYTNYKKKAAPKAKPKGK